MIGHVSVGVTDLERSRHFYDAVLRPLGLSGFWISRAAAPIMARWLPRSASNSQLPLRRQCHR